MKLTAKVKLKDNRRVYKTITATGFATKKSFAEHLRNQGYLVVFINNEEQQALWQEYYNTIGYMFTTEAAYKSFLKKTRTNNHNLNQKD